MVVGELNRIVKIVEKMYNGGEIRYNGGEIERLIEGEWDNEKWIQKLRDTFGYITIIYYNVYFGALKLK